MLYIDYYFFYKYNIRFLLLLKIGIFNIFNTYKIPFLDKLLFFFSLNKQTDLNNISIYNYLYLFKFFFGKDAFITKYKSKFNLGTWYYKFKVFIIILKKNSYNFLYFFFNNFIYFIDNIFIKYNILKKKNNIISILLTDLNIFSEKKSNLGLFNLNDNLNIYILFSGIDININKLFLKNLKIKHNLL